MSRSGSAWPAHRRSRSRPTRPAAWACEATLMRVVFAGTPEVALPSLRAVADSAARAGRRRHASGRPDRARPQAHRLARRGGGRGRWASRCSSPSTRATRSFQDALRALEPDACPVVAYGALLPQSALDIPRHGWVNLHFSLLPAWRGAAPVQRADLGRRRRHRRDDVPDRQGARRRSDVRRDDRDDPADGHRRRPARAARRGRRRAAGRDPRRHRRRLARGTAPAAEDVSLAPKITRRRRAGGLGPARGRDRPAGPGLHARTRRLDDVRRRAAQARPARAGRRPAPPGRDRGGKNGGRRRHRHGRAAARRRPGGRASGRCRRQTGPAGCG